MSEPVVLHVPGAFGGIDGQTCLRCGIVLSDGPLTGFDQLAVVPTGHFSSARYATADERRSGVLCAPKQRGMNTIGIHNITVDVYPWMVGGISCVVVLGLLDALRAGSGTILSLTEAMALAQALREAITEAEARR